MTSMDTAMAQVTPKSRHQMRAHALALCTLLTMTGAACAPSGPLDVRAGPQAMHPGDLARGVNNPPVGTTSVGGSSSAGATPVADLFRAICEANEGNFANAVPAAVASGAFGPPQTTTTDFGSQRTSLMSPDGQVETVIVVASPNDPGGSSCGVGTRDGTELYVILPTGSLRPA